MFVFSFFSRFLAHLQPLPNHPQPLLLMSLTLLFRGGPLYFFVFVSIFLVFSVLFFSFLLFSLMM